MRCPIIQFYKKMNFAKFADGHTDGKKWLLKIPFAKRSGSKNSGIFGISLSLRTSVVGFWLCDTIMFEFMGLSETFKKLQNIFIWNQKVNRVKIKCHLDMQMQLCFDQKCNLRRCCNKWKVVIYWIVLQKAKHFNSCTYKVDFRTKINTTIILILLHRIYKI